ncbi:MAG: isoprenyl transferase [Negativicutes bacterium]|nr:isoprenyl transferase [Negativicutes bacterium]MBP9948686.1 isoprenyl transferase [Negativicutes bacterium]
MWKKFFGKNTKKNQTKNSNNIDVGKIPQHIAIIMDGNGRWAQNKGLMRTFGHRAGVGVLKDIVKTASDIGVKHLTVYAFSTENWKRPQDEVDFLMNLFSEYIDKEIDELETNNIVIRFIGEIEKLSTKLQDKFEFAQSRTAKNTGCVLNIAVNYGSRAEIVRAVKIIGNDLKNDKITVDEIDESLISSCLYTKGQPDPDLVIRPSGDIRISNFLLWQIAYAEFWFTDINWPDFKPEHLLTAIKYYQSRERRFGGLK